MKPNSLIKEIDYGTPVSKSPNMVTLVATALVFIVFWLFLQGHYGWGLAGAWLMTFAVAALDWNSTPLLDWTRYVVALPLGLAGLAVTVCGALDLGDPQLLGHDLAAALARLHVGLPDLVDHRLPATAHRPSQPYSSRARSGVTKPSKRSRSTCARSRSAASP